MDNDLVVSQIDEEWPVSEGDRSSNETIPGKKPGTHTNPYSTVTTNTTTIPNTAMFYATHN